MKLKFKVSRRALTVLAVAGLAGVALLVSQARGGGTEEAGTLDNAAVRACDDFAAGAGRARSDTARLALADKVTASAAETGNDAIRNRALELGRRADETNADWRTASTALTQACRDAGWRAP